MYYKLGPTTLVTMKHEYTDDYQKQEKQSHKDNDYLTFQRLTYSNNTPYDAVVKTWLYDTFQQSTLRSVSFAANNWPVGRVRIDGYKRELADDVIVQQAFTLTTIVPANTLEFLVDLQVGYFRV